MADGVSSDSLDQFDRALEEYLRYNRRETGPLIENRCARRFNGNCIAASKRLRLRGIRLSRKPPRVATPSVVA